jgi:hypothetical protein
MFQRFLLAAMLCSLFVACDPNAGKIDSASVTFDGNKKLIVVAQYTPNAQSNGIGAWADVTVGTAATIEMTGPLHMHCDGAFQAPPKDGSYPAGGNRPGLILDAFAAPAGQYTVVVAIPSKNAVLKTTFRAGSSYQDAITGVWDLPRGCVPVADTRLQLDDLTYRHVYAVEIWIGRMDATSLKAQLAPLAARADQAVMAGDKPAATAALTSIRDAVAPQTGPGFYSEILRDATASLALLAQPVPAI